MLDSQKEKYACENWRTAASAPSDLGDHEDGQALALQADGKIVVVGATVGKIAQSVNTDFDRDGLTDFFESALGFDPTIPSSTHDAQSVINGSEFHFSQRKARADLNYLVE
jgi:hypothetical protein